jgi:hypothetical protein
VNAIFRGAFGFVVGYLVFMLPTYVLPYFGSNSAIVGAIGAVVGRGFTPQFWLHAWCLGMLVLVTSIRGKHIGKGWLLIFPVLASFFDLVPGVNLIPLVPTVMHLLALILGAVGSSAAATNTEPKNAPVQQPFGWEPWVAGLMSLTAIGGTLLFVNGVKATSKQVLAPSRTVPVPLKQRTVPASVAVDVTSPSATQSTPSSTTSQSSGSTGATDPNAKVLAHQSQTKKMPRLVETRRTVARPKAEDRPTVRYIDINK